VGTPSSTQARLMTARVVLLTGLPGIGKTTVATALSEGDYERVHFGGLIRTVLEREARRSLSHDEFRRDFTRLVDEHTIRLATVLARKQVDSSTSSVCILDSHAVVPTEVGIRVTPDDSELMGLIRADVIVHLGLLGCVDRVVRNSHACGRNPLGEQEALLAESLQLNTCVLYASSCHAPLFVVKANGSVRETIHHVTSAIRRGLRWRD